MNGIVVVDDEPVDYASMLCLDSPGGTELNYHIFRSGRAVLRVLPSLCGQSVPISLCLINTRLPDMSGFDLLQMLHTYLNSHSRGVMVGSNYCVEDERAARQYGAAFYICKPLQKEWFDRIGSDSVQHSRDSGSGSVLSGHGGAR